MQALYAQLDQAPVTADSPVKQTPAQILRLPARLYL